MRNCDIQDKYGDAKLRPALAQVLEHTGGYRIGLSCIQASAGVAAGGSAGAAPAGALIR